MSFSNYRHHLYRIRTSYGKSYVVYEDDYFYDKDSFWLRHGAFLHQVNDRNKRFAVLKILKETAYMEYPRNDFEGLDQGEHWFYGLGDGPHRVAYHYDPKKTEIVCINNDCITEYKLLELNIDGEVEQ